MSEKNCKRGFFGSSHQEVFLLKGVLKIRSKFTGQHPCQSVILIKLLCNFVEITLWHGCSPVNLLHIFRTPFCRNTSEWLPLFFIKKNSQGSCLVKTDVWWQNLALGKFQNLIGKVIFVCPGKAFTIYEPNCTYICRRNRTV